MKNHAIYSVLKKFDTVILASFILSNMFIGGNSLVSGEASGDFSTGISNILSDIAQFILPEPEPVVYLPESLTLTSNNSVIYIGTSNRITATFSPSNTTDKSLVWSSSDPSILEVTTGGIAIARDFGTATITAQTHVEAVKGTIELTVMDFPDVTDFMFEAKVLDDVVTSIDVGTTALLSLTNVTPSNGKTDGLTFSSGDESIATISDDRIVTGISEGNVTLTADFGSISKSINFAVTTPLEPVIAPTELTLEGPTTGYVGRTIQLTPNFGSTTPTDTQMTFKSSHPNVARVNSLGVVTGVNFSGLTARDVVITAYPNANPTLVETFAITIEKVFPTNVTLTANRTVTAGNSMSITPTFTPSDTTDRQLIWTSSNPDIASVSSAGDTGLLVGQFSGTVTITATSVMDDTIVSTISIEILPATLFSNFSQFVRKGIGHFSLNFLNGILGFLTFYVYIDPKKMKYLWVSIAVGVPLSMFHEALQFLAPGRTPTWMDAFYNTSGYLAAQLFMVLFFLFVAWRIKRRAFHKAHPRPS